MRAKDKEKPQKVDCLLTCGVERSIKVIVWKWFLSFQKKVSNFDALQKRKFNALSLEY